jgi:putative membrane protein
MGQILARTAFVAVGMCCLTLAASRADEETRGDAKGHDAKFVMKAAEGGLAEVKLGKLATEKAMSADVRKFGQRMVDDHTQANKQLMAIAERKGLKVPTEMNRKDQETYDRMARLSGAEFDRAYAKHMVEDHEEDISEFKDESKNGQDEQIRAWATKTLPTLEEHLKMAKGLNGSRDR